VRKPFVDGELATKVRAIMSGESCDNVVPLRR
jgi:hypothetical protein